MSGIQLLTRRVGAISETVRSEKEALALDPLKDLGEALLDFDTVGVASPMENC